MIEIMMQMILIALFLALAGNYVLYNMYNTSSLQLEAEQTKHKQTQESLKKEKKIVEELRADQERARRTARELQARVRTTSLQVATLQKKLKAQAPSASKSSAEVALDLIREELDKLKDFTK